MIIINYKSMKCALLDAKIAALFETVKRILLKDVKGFEKVRFTSFRADAWFEIYKTAK